MNTYFVPCTVCSDAEANIKVYDIIPVNARHDIILLGKQDAHTEKKKRTAGQYHGALHCTQTIITTGVHKLPQMVTSGPQCHTNIIIFCECLDTKVRI